MPTLAVFGDSVTFGQNTASWAWEMGLPQVQILNAAVEGMALEGSVERFQQLRKQVNLIGAVVHPGWNNIFYAQRQPKLWKQTFDEFTGLPVVPFCTLAADFTLTVSIEAMMRHCNATTSIITVFVEVWFSDRSSSGSPSDN
jgi:hypothetical protein